MAMDASGRRGRVGRGGRAALLLSMCLVVPLLLLIILKWGPEWLAPAGLDPKDRADQISGNRTALFTVAAGLIALVGALYTARTYGLSRQGQITDRFTRAIDQLGADKVEVSLGGIYALERIALESPRDHGPIMEVLTAYVRERALFEESRVDTDPGRASDRVLRRLPTDVQAAMIVVGRRRREHDVESHQVLEFSGADLRGVRLLGAHLEGANFVGTHLEGANLSGAYLQGARFAGAHLQGANLSGAHLEEADFSGADLEKANLTSAILSDANFRFALLSGALLRDADLRRANLFSTKMVDAVLWNADLDAASVWNADLSGAELVGAHTKRVRSNAATTWPEGYNPPAK